MKLKNNLTNIDDFTINNLALKLKEFSKSNNVVYSKLMKILRNIISGLKASIKSDYVFSHCFLYLLSYLQQGPSVSEIMVILGKEEVIDRLNRACLES